MLKMMGGNPSLRYSLRVYDVELVELNSVAVHYTSYLVEHLTPEASYWFSLVVHSSTGDSDIGWSEETITSPCK